MKTKLRTIAAAALLLASTAVQAVESIDGVNYIVRLKSGSTTEYYAFVIGVTAGTTEVVIPETIEGMVGVARQTVPVTSIGGYNDGSTYYPFQNNTTITSITIGANVETIYTTAFGGCTSLKTVTFASGSKLADIQNRAFQDCTALETVTFAASTLTGDETMTIGESAFQDCTALTSIDLSPCTKLKSIGKSAFRDCTSVRYTKLPSSIVNGPSEGAAGTVAVGSYAFTGCTGTLDLSEAELTDATKIPFIDTSFARNNVSNTLGGSKFDASMFIYLPKNYTGDKPKNGTFDSQSNIAYWDGSAWICPEYRTSSTKVIYMTYPVTVQKYASVRNISSGKTDTYTICLPYTPPAVTGLTYYELSSVSGTTLTFTEAASPEAYKPYLIATDAATYTINLPFDISASGTSVSFPATPDGEMAVTADGYKMVGTLTNISAAETVGKYILQNDNKWQKTDSEISGVNIPALRAYIVATGGAGAPSLSTSFDGDNGTTAIQNVRTVAQDGTEQWYDLNGRRIAAPTQKGIYIINGKKVVR